MQLLRIVLWGAQSELAARLANRELKRTLRSMRHPPTSTNPLPSPENPTHAWSDNSTVRVMISHIHTHYRHPLVLADVAEALKMNASYLSNLFSLTMGVTFRGYLNELRISKAKELLMEPALRICEIAAAVGYSTPNYFNNIFKAREGLSPAAWRNAVR